MHRIQHIGLEVITSGLAAPPERWEEDLQQLGTASFWEPLDAVFDVCGDPESVWQIDTLSITVVINGEGDWRRSLQNEIRHAVGEILLAKGDGLHGVIARRNQTEGRPARQGAKGKAAGDGNDEEIRILPIARQRFEDFLYYLAAGALPWTADTGQFSTDYLQREFPAILRQYGEEWKAFLSRHRSLTGLIRRRLTAQCPEILAECVLDILVPEMVSRMGTRGRSWCDRVGMALEQQAPASLERLLQGAVMTEVLEGWQDAPPWEEWMMRIGGRWLQIICAGCFPASPSARQRFLQTLLAVLTASGDPGDRTLMRVAEGMTRMDLERQAGGQKDDVDAGVAERISPTDPAGSHDEDSGDENISSGVQYEVAQGGMVLLYPYMNSFFVYLGLLDERSQFTSDEARQHAVYWWHSLAGSGTSPMEPECILGKVLCDMPIPAVLEYRPAWLENDLKEGRRLLEAFIHHWTALKDCSVEALQETFLSRRARLQDKGGSWLLRVDGSGVDILLDRLPFTLSQIYLPWLRKPMEVEWL